MEKSADALKTIGEMSKALGVQPHILRYWEEQFSALNPLKRAGGRRYYRTEDAALLREIHHLIYDKGFTIKGAQKHMRANQSGEKTSPTIAAPISAPSAPAISAPMSAATRRELESIVRDLRKALAA